MSEAECIPRNRVFLQPARATKSRGGIKITPFVGGKGIVEVEGKRSPVWFATDSKPKCVFQAAQKVDPQSVAQIVTFTVKKVPSRVDNGPDPWIHGSGWRTFQPGQRSCFCIRFRNDRIKCWRIPRFQISLRLQTAVVQVCCVVQS